MCIIIAKYRGNKLPKKETLENCFYNNNDGAGIAYTHNGKVFIDKGYNKFDEFYKRLRELNKQYNLKNENVVLHFRIGTSGNMDARATHPFPISASTKKLQAPKLNNLSVAVAHNGVISAYAYKNDDGLSDTQNFIKDFMTPLKAINKDFYKYDAIQKLIEKTISSKLAIIDNDSIQLIGTFEQGTDGNYYSNQSYKTDYYKQTYKSFNWSDYYSDYYSDEKIKDYNNKTTYNDYNYYTYKDAKDTMLLNEYLYIQYGNSTDEIYQANNYDCIDKNNNLYEIVDFYRTANGTLKFILEPLDTNVTILDEDLKEVLFEPNGATEFEGVSNE